MTLSLYSCASFINPPYNSPLRNISLLRELEGSFYVLNVLPDPSGITSDTDCRNISELVYRGNISFFDHTKNALNYELEIANKRSPSGQPISIYFSKITLSATGQSRWIVSGRFSIGKKENKFEINLPYTGHFDGISECSEANVQFNNLISDIFLKIYEQSKFK